MTQPNPLRFVWVWLVFHGVEVVPVVFEGQHDATKPDRPKLPARRVPDGTAGAGRGT